MKIIRIIKKLFSQRSEIEQYRTIGVKIGSNCNFYSVFIDRCFSHLITIGNNVTITHSTLIAHDASTKRPLGYSKVGKITIGDDVFIGHGSIILGNTSSYYRSRKCCMQKYSRKFSCMWKSHTYHLYL